MDLESLMKPHLRPNREGRWECHFSHRVTQAKTAYDAYIRMMHILQPHNNTLQPHRATQTKPDSETFGHLLDSLEDTFSSLNIPPIKDNWLPNKDIRALHKLGIYIPSPWLLEICKDPTLPTSLTLPAIASALFINSKYDVPGLDGKVGMRFVFAMKHPHLPATCERIAGVPFMFGGCLEIHGEKKYDATAPGKMFWVWAWVVVTKDGKLVFPRELRGICEPIHHRRRLPAERQKGAHISWVHNRHWALPSLLRQDDHPHDEFVNTMACTFRQLILWWTKREERWSVGIRKEGKRATFSIAPEHTAAYFRDREKQVNINGSTKRIIHFVKKHMRVNGAVVKAHVRGLREFDWRGHHCYVTAPKLKGAIYTNFPLTPKIVVKEKGENWLDIQEVVEILADSEDFNRQSRLQA